MRRALVAAALCGLLGGCQSGPAAGPTRLPTAPASLRVMTFNIRYGTANDGPNHWSKRRELTFGILRDHRPDAVGLQEALRFQIDEIRQALPEYGEIGVGREDGKTAGEYSAILYRSGRLEVLEQGTFWLSDTPEVPGSRSWGNSIPRICTWARLADKLSGRRFYLYNTHLDHQSQPGREQGAELIARHMGQRAHSDPIIFTGDMNSGEDNVVIRYLEGESREVPSSKGPCAVVPPLLDTFRLLHPDARQVGTFNGFVGKRDGPKIDYILVSPQWKVLEASIVHDHTDGRYPSDHFPVMAVVE